MQAFFGLSGVVAETQLASGGRLYGLDRDKSPQSPAVNEVHPAANLSVEGVIFSTADIQARLVLGATLPHDDGTTRDHLPREDLHTESLSVGVAAVFRAA